LIKNATNILNLFNKSLLVSIIGFIATLVSLGFTAPERHISGAILSGEVVDSITGEKLPYINVFLDRSRNGVVTDKKGRFNISSPSISDTLIVKSLGYEIKKIPIVSGCKYIPTIKLSTQEITLDEITIKPTKHKYSKKNNPAVELMEKIRKAYPYHNPYNENYYSFSAYDKVTLGINNFKSIEYNENQKGKFGFINNYVDTSAITGAQILNISLKERLSKTISKPNSKGIKHIILASRNVGIDDNFNQENIRKFLEDILRDINIFGDDITLMQNKFVSPLSSIGANYYKYYITDTIDIAGEKCIELSFLPHNPESFGFNGKLYIVKDDSTMFIKKLKMQVPSKINLNYVKNLFIEQEFTRDSIGNRHKTTDDMVVEFQILPSSPELYARRLRILNDFSYTDDTNYTNLYNNEGSLQYADNYDSQNNDFWENTRPVELTSSEASMKSMIDQLRDIPLIYWSEKIISILVKGYLPTGHPSKFDLGPINTLISSNTVEGARFRIGGMTTANLSSKWFSRAYLAYGTSDRKFKYGGELEYSFTDKKYHSREFPIHSIKAEYKYDIDMIGQHYLFTNADNIFLSLKRKTANLVTYQRLAQIEYQLERKNGFSFSISIHHEIQEATRWLPFTNSLGDSYKNYHLSSISIKLRYAPGETFYQAASMRIPINSDAPIIQLTHEYGPKKLFGSDFTINKTELSLQKRIWFSAFGYTDIILKGGKIWSQVQYPALIWPNANLSYTIQPESFALMNPMEFANDTYGSWDITYWLNGWLFNRIPLFNELKLREVISFRGIYGSLSKKNNPLLNQNLYLFPVDADVSMLNKKPYMEIGVGIDNILTILRLDYVWRLTYRNTPGVDNSGLRLSLHFTF
jgi:hypothetical protein